MKTSNFDECGFQIGVASGDIVYLSLDCDLIYSADPDNRELITVVTTINHGGKRVLVMIVFKGAYHTRQHFKNDIDGNTFWA